MRTPRVALLVILVITVLAFVVDLPENVPLTVDLGPVKINRIIRPPTITLPFLNTQKVIYTHLGLDLLGGTQLVLEADMKDIAEDQRNTALESVKEIVERRVNFFGVAEPVVQTARVDQSYRVIVELPGVSDIEEAVNTLGQTARLEFREMNDEATGAATLSALLLTKSTGVTGQDLKKAELTFDTQNGEPIVSFEMTPEGAKKFAELTTRLVGKPLAIFLDDFPLGNPPIVQTAIPDGKGIIRGGFTTEMAKQLSLQLSAGALPAPVKIIEQRNVGATLGAESVERSVKAGLIGLSLVAAFMVLYYGRLGLLADIALIIYGLITFALFRLIPVTLTLPGIAGFILSIGMAVDANILIFERMKEELRKGKPWQIAMELGFGKAWDSIRDANFTTLITAFILFNPLNWNFLPASGVVRGFALTLVIGVLTSLFTGIFVSRNLIRAFYKPRLTALKEKK